MFNKAILDCVQYLLALFDYRLKPAFTADIIAVYKTNIL
jgi:hypothetical protein